MSWSRRRWLAIIITALVVAGVFSNPVRRSSNDPEPRKYSNDPEARRRSVVDRHMIRYGRSSSAEPSAAEIKELLQRNTRRGDSFLRLGRSQALSAEDLITIIRQYEDENGMNKRASTGFIRFGRDPGFIRFGRNIEDDVQNRSGGEKNAVLIGNGYQKRKGDDFLRFGRDSEEINDTGLDDYDGEMRGQ